MRIGYLFSIAFRHLLGQRRQTSLTVGGVAVGVTVLLVISGLMNGLLVSFTETIVDAAPHLTMTGEKNEAESKANLAAKAWPEALVVLTDRGEPSETGFMRAYSERERQAREIPGIDTISPYVASQVIAAGGAETKPLLLSGVIPDREERIVKLNRRVKDGSFDAFRANSLSILLGSAAAKDLDVATGDRLRLISPSGRVIATRVVGIYTTGVKALDEKGYVHLRQAQILEELDTGAVTGLNFTVKDLDAVESTAAALSARTGLKVSTWRETNANIISLFKTIATIATLLVVFTIVVAGFGVANVLITVVLGKSRDISLLRTIGFTRARILALFLIEGGMIGLVGALSGAGLGFVVTTLLSFVPVAGESDYSVRKTLTMDQNPDTYLMTALFALVICLIASVGPARRASRLRPIDVLRGES
ncbi:Lipoprotein-releasing system transmembrane protein LolE [compost metagenome]